VTKVLVLGGKGMLGQMLEQFLSRSEGIDVKYTCRGEDSNAFHFDVVDGIHGLHEIVKRYGKFDYFINCIGILSSEIDEKDSKSVRRAILINALFPHELSILAREIGARVIHISTDGVFFRDSGECIEDSPQDCDDVYGKTKSLGEVITANFLNIRCSIVGPNPATKRSLLEWFLGQPQGATVHGYTDHMWNGVTTLQFAKLCLQLVLSDSFQAVLKEGPIHHFCPNQPLSKYELLTLFKIAFRPDMCVKAAISEGGPISRILATQYQSLMEIFGHGTPMKDAINELLKEM